MTVHWSTSKLIFTHPLDCFFILLSQYLENHLREKVHVYPKGRLLEFHYWEGELKSRESREVLTLSTWKLYVTAPKLTHLWSSHALTATLSVTMWVTFLWDICEGLNYGLYRLAAIIWLTNQMCTMELNKHHTQDFEYLKQCLDQSPSCNVFKGLC